MRLRLRSVTLWIPLIAISVSGLCATVTREARIAKDGEAPSQESQRADAITVQNSALLPESWARKSTTAGSMPTYPVEAVRRGVSGVVYIRFETSPEGEVVRIKVKPGTQSTLGKAVVEAVKEWKFKSWHGADGLPETVFSRLAFSFIIVGGVPSVALHNASSRLRSPECLECSNSNKEMNQWRDWDEAWSSTQQ